MPTDSRVLPESDETITLGGITLRFIDGQLQRRWADTEAWRPALYTSVRPDDAEAYAAFCRRHLRVSGDAEPPRDEEALVDDADDERRHWCPCGVFIPDVTDGISTHARSCSRVRATAGNDQSGTSLPALDNSAPESEPTPGKWSEVNDEIAEMFLRAFYSANPDQGEYGWDDFGAANKVRLRDSAKRALAASVPALDGEGDGSHRRAIIDAPVMDRIANIVRHAKARRFLAASIDVADLDAVLAALSSSGRATCDCTRLRERLAALRDEMRGIAALFGITPCDEDRPASWTNGVDGSVSLIDMLRPFASGRDAEGEDTAQLIADLVAYLPSPQWVNHFIGWQCQVCNTSMVAEHPSLLPHAADCPFTRAARSTPAPDQEPQ